MTAIEVQSAVPDLNDPQTFVEGVPYGFFAKVRATDGLYWQATEDPGYPGPGFWVATRRADILAIENDPQTFTCTGGIVPHLMVEELVGANNVGSIMHVDPPVHSRLRRVVSKSFAPRVVANFETWVRDIVTEALDDAVALGEFDFVKNVAAVIPSRTIAKVVGVPDELRENIVSWTNELFNVATLGNRARGTEIQQLIEDLADELRIEKLVNPAEDIISYLAPFERDGEISNVEFRQFARTFVNAGFETTHTTISQSVRLLIENPAIAAKVDEVMASDGPDSIADEFIRMISPVMTFMRTATRDTEVAGTKIKAGDVVSQWYGAANRDPELFENPDEFIPGRANGHDHLAFGVGAHRCLGAPLAKLQIRTLLEELHRRGLRFQLAGEPRRGWSSFINALTYLPVKVVAGA